MARQRTMTRDIAGIRLTMRRGQLRNYPTYGEQKRIIENNMHKGHGLMMAVLCMDDMWGDKKGVTTIVRQVRRGGRIEKHARNEACKLVQDVLRDKTQTNVLFDLCVRIESYDFN